MAFYKTVTVDEITVADAIKSGDLNFLELMIELTATDDYTDLLVELMRESAAGTPAEMELVKDLRTLASELRHIQVNMGATEPAA